MNDLEQRLRADLVDAADPVGGELDTDALLVSAHRARNVRTARRVGAVAAVAVVAAAMSWTGLTLPARTAPVLASPDPAPSTSASPSLVPGTRESASFDLSNESPPGATVKKLDVDATVVPDGYRVTFTVTRVDGSTQTQTRDQRGSTIAWAQFGSRLLAEFVPHPAEWVEPIGRGDSIVFGGYSGDHQIFSRLNAAASYRLASTGAEGTYTGMKDYIWRDEAGLYHSSRGDLLPSVTLTLPTSGRSATFFREDRFGTLGFAQDGETRTARKKPDELEVSLGWGETEDGLRVSGVFLPADATAPELTFSGKRPEWITARLGDRLIILASSNMANSDLNPMIRTISYTDATGTRVTKKLPG